MATCADPVTQVTISLSADPSSAPGILFPERRIVFRSDRDSIIVGRASKASSKGFIAAIDNAWFDSPVMSRHHAKIVVNKDQKKVEIIDLASLHGTFLNGDPVSRNSFHSLKDGDTLQFGASIWRGTEQFTPAIVKVGIAFSDRNVRGTSTFQVPEGSDDDGSDLDDSSSDNGPSAKKSNGLPRAAHGRATGRHVTDVIDLTDSHNGRSVRGASAESEPDHVIDLSSPARSRASSVAAIDDPTGHAQMRTRPDEFEARSPRVSSVEDVDDYAGSAQLRIRPEAVEDRGDFDDLNDLDDYVPPSGASMRFDDLWRAVGEDLARDSDADVTDTNSASHADYPDESDSEAATDERGAGAESDEDMGDFESEDYASEAESVSMPFTSSDGHQGWSDQTRQESPQQTEFTEVSRLVDSLTNQTRKPSEPVAKSTGPVRIEELLNEQQPHSPISPCHDRETDRLVQEAEVFERRARESSPSKSLYTVPSYHPSSATVTTETLGGKSGKMDYFTAREANKSAVNERKTAKLRQVSSVHALCNTEPPKATPELPSISPNLSRVGFSDPLYSPVMPAGPCTTAVGFSPATGPTLNPCEVVERSSRRTHMGIGDIVNQMGSETETGTKRKADDISEATREENEWAARREDVGGCSTNAHLAEPGNPLPETSPTPSVAPEQHRIESSGRGDERSPINASLKMPERPLKRARLLGIAERIAYAALGGVTAGAMIVGTLIYTAPTFD